MSDKETETQTISPAPITATSSLTRGRPGRRIGARREAEGKLFHAWRG
ncbi:MAG: hypothetical protein WA979_00840 [Pacificimonas sp.]